MTAVTVRKSLEGQLISILETLVGQGSDPVEYVKTFDTYLHDINIDEYPYVVVYARQVEQDRGEMGTLRELNTWNVVIYYIDITKDAEEYGDGESRRDSIVHRIQYALEEDPRLGNLRVDLETESSVSEYVFDSNFTTILFDSSGQEGYFTFVTEMHLDVQTAKN